MFFYIWKTHSDTHYVLVWKVWLKSQYFLLFFHLSPANNAQPWLGTFLVLTLASSVWSWTTKPSSLTTAASMEWMAQCYPHAGQVPTSWCPKGCKETDQSCKDNNSNIFNLQFKARLLDWIVQLIKIMSKNWNFWILGQNFVGNTILFLPGYKSVSPFSTIDVADSADHFFTS